MLAIKSGVKMEGLQPQVLLAIIVAQEVYRSFGYDSFFITSLSEGKHKTGSLHYSGRAVDIRTRGVLATHVPVIHYTIQSRLGDNFDVVLESTHIHIEYDPKN